MTCNAVVDVIILAAIVVVDLDVADIDPILLPPLAEVPPAANNGLKPIFRIVLCSAIVGKVVADAGGRSGGVLNADNDDAANGERPNRRDDEIEGSINAVTNFRAGTISPNCCDGGSTEK